MITDKQTELTDKEQRKEIQKFNSNYGTMITMSSEPEQRKDYLIPFTNKTKEEVLNLIGDMSYLIDNIMTKEEYYGEMA